MYVRRVDDLLPTPPDQAIQAADQLLRQAVEQGGRVALVLSPFLTVEEAYLLAQYARNLSPSATLALGPVPTRGEDVTFQPDKIKGRTGDTTFLNPRPFTIHAEKCPNRNGVSMLLEHFQGEVVPYDSVRNSIESGAFSAVFLAMGAIEDWNTESQAQAIRAGVKSVVLLDTRVTPLAHLADVVLSGATFAEKAGCYVNAQGRLQYAEAALPPRDGSLPDLDIAAILAQRSEPGPIASKSILVEIAQKVPAFANAAGGVIPRYGVALRTPATPSTTPPPAPPFQDLWSFHRAERV